MQQNKTQHNITKHRTRHGNGTIVAKQPNTSKLNKTQHNRSYTPEQSRAESRAEQRAEQSREQSREQSKEQSREQSREHRKSGGERSGAEHNTAQH